MNINSYGILFILSFVISYVVVIAILVHRGIKKQFILYSAMFNFFITLYFAKLFTVITSGFKLNILNAGFSSLGGVIGLLLGIYIFGLIYKEGRRDFYLAYCHVIPLLYSVSKLGCHFAGCCHGIPYEGPLHISYNNDLFQTGNIFPVQAAESLLFFVIFAVGMVIGFKIKSKYSIEILMLMCAVGKFLMAYLREEQIGVILSPNQIVCIVFAVISVTAVIFKIRRTNEVTHNA